MLSLHYANKKNNRCCVSLDEASVMNRAIWMEWVRRSRRSQIDLIDQEFIDPHIQQHMSLESVIPISTTTTTNAMKYSNVVTPTMKSSYPHLTERRVSVMRPSHLKSKDDTKGTEKPRELPRVKRKEIDQSNTENDKKTDIPSPELVRVTTSMVLGYQEGIWQLLQLERQSHLPPPRNHQKRRFIQEDSGSSLAAVEYHCSELREHHEIAVYFDAECHQSSSQPSCPVCRASAHLTGTDEAIFHCESCGALASNELIRSLLAQDRL